MLKRFWQDDSGNFLVGGSVALVPIIVAIMGVSDYTLTLRQKDNAQNALDAAGIAIATRIGRGMTDTQLNQLGEDVFSANTRSTGNLQTKFEFPGIYYNGVDGEPQYEAGTYITVKTKFVASSLFEHIYRAKADLETQVTIQPGKPACVVSLNQTASPAVRVNGSTTVNLDGCAMAANSTADDAISRNGNAEITADCVSTVGGTNGIYSSSRVDLECGAPVEGGLATADPLLGLAVPSNGNCRSLPPKGKSGPAKLKAGTYCNKKITGSYELEAGVYILDGGSIEVNGNASFTGQDVTIFLKNGAGIRFGGGVTVDLRAPDEGDYAGVLIYSVPGNTAELNFGGGANTTLEGFVYASDAHIDFAGNSAAADEGACLRIIGATVDMSGNTAMKANCEGVFGDIDSRLSGPIRLLR